MDNVQYKSSKMIIRLFDYLFTQDLLNQVICILMKNNFPQIKSIDLGFGPFSNGNFEKIKFWWKKITKNSTFQNVILNKVNIDGKIICFSCNKKSIFMGRTKDDFSLYQEVILCPKCKSFATHILYGTEIVILNLEVDSTTIPS